MTLRIECISMKRETRIRLSGELRSEQLSDVGTEVQRDGQQVTLDLDELNLLDLDAVRFLNACEAQNVQLVNCPPYVREWMSQERAREKLSERT
jgi:hypothetical protein